MLRTHRAGLVAGTAVAGWSGFLYLSTVGPTFGFGDSPELSASAANLTLAHPPGYTLWTALAWAFSQAWPWGDAAHRVNLFCALVGVVASLLVMLACLETIRVARAPNPCCAHTPQGLDYTCAALCAAALATAPPVWGSASTAEVYTATLALSASFLWLALRSRRSDSVTAASALGIGAFAGLCLGHQLTSAAAVVAGLVPLALARRRPAAASSGSRRARTALAAVAGLALGLLPLVLVPYLGSRTGARPWPMPDGPGAFLGYVTGHFYARYMFNVGTDAVSLAAADAVRRIGGSAGAALVLAAASGVAIALARRVPGAGSSAMGRPRAAATAALLPGAILIVSNWVFAWSYTAYDRDVFFLQALLGLTLIAAAGLALGADSLGRILGSDIALGRAMPPLFFGLLLALITVQRYPAQDASGCVAARDYAESALASLPSDTLLVIGNDLTVGDHLAFPIIYMQEVEGRRRDVLVLMGPDPVDDRVWEEAVRASGLAANDGAALLGLPRDERWAALAERRLSGRPVRFTNWASAQAAGVRVAAAGWFFAPAADEPDANTVEPVAPARADDTVQDVCTTPERVAGVADVLRGDLRRGTLRLERATHAAPRSLANNVLLSHALLARGDATGALVAADRARRAWPLLHAGWHARGLALHELGRFDEAVESFRIALAVDRKSVLVETEAALARAQALAQAKPADQ